MENLTTNQNSQDQQINSLKNLSNQQVLQILLVSNIARPNSFELLSDTEWVFIAQEVKDQYPNITKQFLINTVKIGIKGKLNKAFPPINSMTIFRWIDSCLNSKYRIAGKNQNGPFDTTEDSEKEYLKIKNNPNNTITIDQIIYEKW